MPDRSRPSLEAWFAQLSERLDTSAGPRRFWRRLLACIGLAGGYLPVLVSLVCIFIAIVWGVLNPYGVERGFVAPALLALGGVVFGPVTFAFGFMHTMIVALPTMVVVRVAAAACGVRPSLVWLGSGVGAIVMFLTTAPLLVWSRRDLASSPAAVVLAHGAVALTIVCGQAAGCIAAARLLRSKDRNTAWSLRFGLRQLLGLTAMTSVLLSLASVSGLLIADVGYAVVLGATLYAVTCRPAFAAVDAYLRGRFRRRRERRLARST